jgi:RND superfamily putative drug exporter
MRRFAELVLHHRVLVVIVWVALIVSGVAASGAVGERLKLDFSLPGQPGTEAAHKIIKDFGNGGNSSPFLVLLTAPDGQQITGNEPRVGKAFAALGDKKLGFRVLDEATTASKDFRTKDDRTAFAMVFYRFGNNPQNPLPTKELRVAVAAATPSGWTNGVTGEDLLGQGDSDAGGNSVLIEALLGAVGALIVLAFVFASFLALLPMVVAFASIMLTFLLLLPTTYVMDVSFIVQFLVALIGLGVAIDYSLLLVTRWREERDHGRDNHQAVVVAMETAGKAVVFSGVTVAIGLIALVVLPVPFMRSIGIGGALIPLACVATTLTLTPAILSSIGPKVDWPKIRHENQASPAWSKWARGVVKNRVVATVVALAVMTFFIAAFSTIKIGLAGSDSLAKSGPAYESLKVLKDGGVPLGIITPLQVLTTADGAAKVAGALRGVDGISSVAVATDAANQSNGRTVVIAVPAKETVNSTTVGPIRRAHDVVDGDPAVLGIAGPGADQIDFLKAVYGNFPLMLTIIAVLTFILLARAFRSVLLPLKAVILNLITLAATLGFMVLFWQNGHGANAVFGVAPTGAVTFWVPLMVFAFLFGLSMDYEVFILARIREEYDAKEGLDTDGAVVEGIARTGRLVTSAALILFLSFVALSSGPGTDLKVFASALGFGILLDATIVRSLLVPALVSLFGTWNWWMPTWLEKLLRLKPLPASAPAALAD